MSLSWSTIGCPALAVWVLLCSTAQEPTVARQLRQVCVQSFKGTLVSGVVSDKGLSEFYNARLDYEGTGLSLVGKTDLLSGYAIQGVDGSGRTHSGDIRVSAIYAWSGGDYHNWVAYFPTTAVIQRVILKKGRHRVGSLNLSVQFGDSPKFKLFEVNAGRVRWHADTKSAEVAVSTDGGASWFSNPQLRSSLNTAGVEPSFGTFHGDVLVLIQGYDKGVIYVNCLTFRR
jgi:hypothetical protein